MKNIGDMAKSIFNQKNPKTEVKNNVESLGWIAAADQPRNLHNIFIWPLGSHCSCMGIDLASFLKRLTSKSFTHMTVAGLRKRQKYILLSRTRVYTKVKKSFNLELIFCVHQQHITKENFQFFCPKFFFILNYRKKKLKIKGSFLFFLKWSCRAKWK